MSSLHVFCCLLSVKKQKHGQFYFFHSMYTKTIITFGFCDIHIYQMQLCSAFPVQPGYISVFMHSWGGFLNCDVHVLAQPSLIMQSTTKYFVAYLF